MKTNIIFRGLKILSLLGLEGQHQNQHNNIQILNVHFSLHEYHLKINKSNVK